MKAISKVLKRFMRASAEREEPATSRWGRMGEDAAAEYLRKEAGFRILMRNWRRGRNEIDLIAREGQCLVFVEVRTRAKGSLVQARGSLGKEKKKALKRAVQIYLEGLRKRPEETRIDLVAVTHEEGTVCDLEHYRGIGVGFR